MLQGYPKVGVQGGLSPAAPYIVGRVWLSRLMVALYTNTFQ